MEEQNVTEKIFVMFNLSRKIRKKQKLKLVRDLCIFKLINFYIKEKSKAIFGFQKY